MAFSLVLCGRFAIKIDNWTAQLGRGDDYLTTTLKAEMFGPAVSMCWTDANMFGTTETRSAPGTDEDRA